jgi:hypothetical protein
LCYCLAVRIELSHVTISLNHYSGGYPVCPAIQRFYHWQILPLNVTYLGIIISLRMQSLSGWAVTKDGEEVCSDPSVQTAAKEIESD